MRCAVIIYAGLFEFLTGFWGTREVSVVAEHEGAPNEVGSTIAGERMHAKRKAGKQEAGNAPGRRRVSTPTWSVAGHLGRSASSAAVPGSYS